MKGFWGLEGSNPPLYTRKAAIRFKDKKTGRVYKRGKMEIFWNGEPTPPTIEETGDFEYDYRGLDNKKPRKSTDQELLQEIATSTLINQTKGRR